MSDTMTASYERINYRLRPAKAIVRKMLCETFRRLALIAKVESYRYIGFGSPFFSDFILFHKLLGIKDMLSIERDQPKEERFHFNRPFKCVRLRFGESRHILPELPWDSKTILWLDYDEGLDGSKLADVMFFVASAPAGSVLIITVNAQPEDAPEMSPGQRNEYRLKKLVAAVGELRVPNDIDGSSLRGWGLARVGKRIITDEIRGTLNDRNGEPGTAEGLRYKQLFNFHYRDGAMMQTVGGLLYAASQDDSVNGCAFEDLSFVRCSDEPYLIKVPSLTFKEIRHLDAQLPVEDYSQLNAAGISQEDLAMYGQLYRYFPTFAEAEM